MFHNNWLEWSYDGKKNSPKLTPISNLSVQLNKSVHLPVKTHFESLKDNARLTRDCVNGELDLFFSGGVASQVMLYSYLEARIPVNIFVTRYKNNLNARDYNTAVRICQGMGLPFNTIDIDLEKFFENDAESIFNKTHCLDSNNLLIIKMLEYSNGVPVVANKEPYISRPALSYDKKVTWNLKMFEDNFSIAGYLSQSNRQSVPNWFYYSPEVVLSMLDTPVVRDIMDDKIYGKISLLSSRCNIYKQYWPRMIDRVSQVGYESEEAPNLLPKIVLEFYNNVIADSVKNTTPLVFNKEQLVSNICY
jgi:hypothetical protein